MENFTVLMSVYKNDNPSHLKQAIESILIQSVVPEEFIIIRDGVVPKETQEVLDFFVKEVSTIKYIPLEINHGLGHCLQIGVALAKNNLIARMDADDIALKNRFELQLLEFQKQPMLSVCGTQINEFHLDEKSPKVSRVVPVSNDKIIHFLKKRNPFNHMTVMFRKEHVLKSGNYIDFHYLEDYFLWCRMSLNKYHFYNIDKVLVLARTGPQMYERRGGLKYFKSLKKLEQFKLQNKIINKFNYFTNILGRFIVHVLVPNRLRFIPFKFIARKKVRR